MSSDDTLVIGGVGVRPGEARTIELPVARQYDGSQIHMPVRVIRGKTDGPRLFISGAIHGDEVNGVEIIRRILRSRTLRGMKGTLIAVPIVNGFGYNSLTRYLPDRRDLNRSFPGSPTGSLAARLAHLFVTEILERSTHGIDIHTGSKHRTNLAQVRACLNDAATSRLAHAFDVPVILDAEVINGSLREAAVQRGLPFLVYEGGESLRYDEIAIRCGVAGILSVMHCLKMIEAPRKPARHVKSLVAQGTTWVRAPRSGSLLIRKKLGQVVEKDDLLGEMCSPLGDDVTAIRSPQRGLVIGHTRLPLLNRGDAAFHIATFERTKPVQESVEQFDDKFDYEER